MAIFIEKTKAEIEVKRIQLEALERKRDELKPLVDEISFSIKELTEEIMKLSAQNS